MYARSNVFASQRPIFPVAILFGRCPGRYLHRGSLAIRLRRTRSPYRCKIRSEVKCLTRPEIEMLVIIAEDCHDDFQKRRMKPSIYCKDVLGLPEVKTYGFFRSCFSDIDLLLYDLLNEGSEEAKPESEIRLWNSPCRLSGCLKSFREGDVLLDSFIEVQPLFDIDRLDIP